MWGTYYHCTPAVVDRPSVNSLRESKRSIVGEAIDKRASDKGFGTTKEDFLVVSSTLDGMRLETVLDGDVG